MNERRIKRLQQQIMQRAASVVTQELSDPRRGMITVTRVELDREMTQCKIYWSILGDEKARTLNAHMLDHAAKYVQREIAAILHTRTVPRVLFVFDERIEGALRVNSIIEKLRVEREAREAQQGGSDSPPPAMDAGEGQ